MGKKLLRCGVLILLSFVTGGPVWSAEPSIQARLDRDTVSVDDTLTLTIVIRGGTTFSTPDIPPLGHFDVVGRSSGNAIEIINGNLSSTMTYEYLLSPRAPGDFSIGPIKVYIEGQEYSAGPLKVHVNDSQGARSYLPSSPPQQPGPAPGFPSPSGPSLPKVPNPPPNEESRDTFLTADTDRKEAYVGQQVLYTFRLYTSVNIQNAQLTLPEFKDFITEELVKENKYQVQLGGRPYAVNEWRLALFPTKSGLLKTGEVHVEGSIPVTMRNSPFDDPFFNNFAVSWRHKSFTAPNVNIQVKDLPPPPPNFSGLVGDFGISSTLSKDSMNLGDTTNLKIEVSGKGNIGEATSPKIADLPYFKVYADKPEVQINKSIQGVSGKKIFTYALVAERPGTTTFPPMEWSYFNPNLGTYEKLSTPAMNIHIMGSSSNEKLVTAGLSDSQGADAGKTRDSFDLRPITPASMILYTQIMPIWEKSLVSLCLLLPPLGFLAFIFLQRYQENVLAHADDRKRSRAFKRAKGALAKLPGAKDASNFTSISSIVKEYLGDRFLVKGAALIPSEVEELLRTRHVPVEIVRHMAYLLEQLDLWKYGGVTIHLPSEKVLKQELIELLREVEKSA
jgi:oxygen tolerance protein BatD